MGLTSVERRRIITMKLYIIVESNESPDYVFIYQISDIDT
jgi:hypothetical protein